MYQKLAEQNVVDFTYTTVDTIPYRYNFILISR